MSYNINIKKYIVGYKKLIVIENAISDHVHRQFCKVVPNLPYIKNQYSEMPNETLRWVFNAHNALTREDYSKLTSMGINPSFHGDEMFLVQENMKEFMATVASDIFETKLECASMYVNYSDITTHHTQHTDTDYHFSAIYYPVKDWCAEFGGETVFIDDDGEIAQSILPRPRRAIFFDSMIPHIARGPAPLANRNRYSIAFKFLKTGEPYGDSKDTVVQGEDKPRDKSSENNKQGKVK